jgi:hypothetical protein
MYEADLPRFAHDSLGYKARPRYRQIDLLNKVLRRSLCLGLLALIRGLLSLQDYGCIINCCDGLMFWVTWSGNSQVISWIN